VQRERVASRSDASRLMMGRRRRPNQRRTLPYRQCHIVSVTGPRHAPTFTAETALNGQVGGQGREDEFEVGGGAEYVLLHNAKMPEFCFIAYT